MEYLFFFSGEMFGIIFGKARSRAKKSSQRVKVSKGAKIRNRYNQVPHLTQDNNGKVTNS